MVILPKFDRVAFSPAEFAKLFGKARTWGYRQIYAGRVKAITQHGRTLIAAAEVQKILESAGIYDGLGKPVPAKSKPDIQKLAPKLKNTWAKFLQLRRQGAVSGTRSESEKPARQSSMARQAALRRLTKGSGSEG